MSSTTHTHPTPPAPWAEAFQSHISELKSPEFVLSTLHPAPGTSAGYVPRARYCIYRGMWASLPENKHNDAERNPPIYTSDLPTFTSDVRMTKVADFFATGPGKAEYPSPNHPNNTAPPGTTPSSTIDDPSSNNGSNNTPNNPPPQATGCGGGGPVEAVFWIADLGTQWRIRGTAWVVAPDVENTRGDVPGAVSSGVRALKASVGKWMRPVRGNDAASRGDDSGAAAGSTETNRTEWSYSRELRAHFGNCSPGMRGSWRNPPPGTPSEGKRQEDLPEEEKLGQKVMDLDDERARANFRVVVIVPEEVERTDIKVPEEARRWIWRVVEGGEGDGEGKEGVRWEGPMELWP